jgi:hypothetical protein
MVDRAILRRVSSQLDEENSELRELLRHYIQSLSASRELSEAGMNSVRLENLITYYQFRRFLTPSSMHNAFYPYPYTLALDKSRHYLLAFRGLWTIPIGSLYEIYIYCNIQTKNYFAHAGLVIIYKIICILLIFHIM